MSKRTNKIFTKRGSLAVETAIILPLLIIGVLTLGYLIRMVSIEERVFHSFADETHLLAGQGKIQTKWFHYGKDVKERITEENNGKVSNPKISNFMPGLMYFNPLTGRRYNSLITASLTYEVDIPLPSIFKRNATMEDTIVCRAFTGGNNRGEGMSFEEMEEDKESDRVWVFPRAGEKYHDENCGYIKSNYRETYLSNSVKKKYTACKHCKPDNANLGTMVYTFPSSGEAYHLGSCHAVDKYVIPISETAAKEKGYTACSKCGG